MKKKIFAIVIILLVALAGTTFWWFETQNIETLWDGTYKGEKLNPGVYVYYFEGHCLDNKPFTKTGNITLLK